MTCSLRVHRDYLLTELKSNNNNISKIFNEISIQNQARSYVGGGGDNDFF